jgi:hypothetical protein
LPTLFVYYEGAMKTQLAGPQFFRGMNMTEEEFEYLVSAGKYLMNLHYGYFLFCMHKCIFCSKYY